MRSIVPSVAVTLLFACSPEATLPAVPADQASRHHALQFDRQEFQQAMRKLDDFYAAPAGLQRPQGLAIGGRPDFEGIAAWVFDVYLGSRAGGLSSQQAWQNVVAQIERSDEWRARHPSAAGTAAWTPWAAVATLDRNELMEAMRRLDRYYASGAGLQRPDGLSLGGRPDFEGIAAWVFDVYANARLQGVGVDGAWQRVVTGIEASAEWQSKPHPAVDASTLHGKHLMGYQGWFGAPGDGHSNGWVHWFGGAATAGDATFDVWPDTRELDPDELFDTQMDARGGGKARLWSSQNKKTVARHFRWMKEAGIDGVSMGRFSVATANGGASPQYNHVLQNVREGAEAAGRVFFIWYDVSGHSQATFVADIKADWERLVDQQQITSSPSYLRHRGRPLLGVWGVGIGDRPGTPADWANLINFFKNHPNPKYRVTLLAGGIPGWATDPAWGPIFKSVDVISPWTVGAFANDADADNFARNVLVPDLATCKTLGLDYMPVAFPGFSWHNLQQKHTPSAVNVFPRRGGRFYWHQVSNIVAAGATNLFTAMFDEADEGTAMFKAAVDQGAVPVQGQWLSLDADGEHLSSDFYLRLGGAAGQLLRGELSATSAIPIRRY